MTRPPRYFDWQAAITHFLANFFLTFGFTAWISHFLVPEITALRMALLASVIEGAIFEWSNRHMLDSRFVGILNDAFYWPGQIIIARFPAANIARYVSLILAMPAYVVFHQVFGNFENAALASLFVIMLMTVPIRIFKKDFH